MLFVVLQLQATSAETTPMARQSDPSDFLSSLNALLVKLQVTATQRGVNWVERTCNYPPERGTYSLKTRSVVVARLLISARVDHRLTPSGLQPDATTVHPTQCLSQISPHSTFSATLSA
ncbi:hypothetical protein B0T17DRAFT_149916 [Bombardia bombarda]|uniref:Uncharacterized protein n=1 Tax=Bombardia bombarda TaxID=252184 RepID=A0AA39X6P7_9PEZI|nr:hypothetical protein B0T17DRAFT_149916 [Bombardia bombarda]